MSEEERYKITRRSITQLMPGKKTKQLLFMTMSHRSKTTMLMRPQLGYVKEVVRHALRTSAMELMSDKISIQLRIVMMPELEDVINVTRKDC